MNGEAQVLEKKIVEFPAVLGGVKIVEADNESEHGQTAGDRIETPHTDADLGRENERFARLKKHLRKRSISIL